MDERPTLEIIAPTVEEAIDYYKYWNDRAFYVLDNADMDGFFTVKIYE